MLLTVALAGVSGCGLVPTSAEVSRAYLFPAVSCTAAGQELDVPVPFEPVDPGDIGLAFESFTVPSTNGNALACWRVPAPGSEHPGTVILLHGNTGTRACTLPWLATITSNGYAAVTFDYQGFDDSGGAADVATLYDDAAAVLEWTLLDVGSPRPVHLLGVSLGTGPAIALARSEPTRIASVALDGAFDPQAQLAQSAAQYGLPVCLVELFARQVFAWLFEARAALDEIAVPALFLNAEADARSPIAQARALYDAWGAAKSFWVFSSLDHVQPVFYAKADYAALLASFWADPQAAPTAVTDGVYRD